MAEWRFLRGWSEAELEERLRGSRRLHRNFSAAPTEMTSDRGWHAYVSHAAIGREPAGEPLPDAAFRRAQDAIAAYAFSDPRIVVAHFDPDAPLEGRRMLLEIKVLGLHYLCGTVVGAVHHGTGDGVTRFGYRYDTLEGHIETGAEWFLLSKRHGTGEVRLRIQAAWRAGDFPNWWSRLGFRLLVRRYQRAWHRLAYLRLRALIGAEGLHPLPRRGRLIHEGPQIPAPTIRAMSRDAAAARRAAPSRGNAMRRTTDHTMLTAAALGAVAGVRSMSAPALLSHGLSHGRGRRDGAPTRLLSSPDATRTLKLLAAGEMAADKTPWIPARTRPLSLAGRAASGALVGAGVAGSRRGSRIGGALLGAAAALASAYGAYHLRRLAARRYRVPDAAAGIAEDVLVLTTGAGLLAALR